MGAVTDTGELTNAQTQLGMTTPQISPPSVSSGPILDPTELAHVKAQLDGAPVVAPAATPSPIPQGQTYASPMPDRGILGKIEDAIRMTAAPMFGDRIAAGVNTIAGTGLPGADYAKNLADQQAKTKWAQNEHPYANQVLSGIAPIGAGLVAVATAPEEGALGAATLGGRALYGALSNAPIGAAVAASAQPDLTSRKAIAPIALGAATGAGIGAAAPIAGGLIGNAYSGAANAVTSGAKGISNPVANQLIRSLAAQGVDNTQAVLDRLGPDAMLADTGEGFRAKTQGAAIYNPEGRVIVSDALNGRDAATNSNLKQDIVSAVGPSTASPLQLSAYTKSLRSWEHQALPDIFANAPPVDTSGVLTTIGQGLTNAVGPEAAVLNKARSWLMKPGTDAQGNPTVFPVSDPQTLQNAKMAIDTLIDRGDPSIGVQPGAVAKAQGAIGAVRDQLNQSLREQVPGYSDVMDKSAALARHADAIDAGYNDVIGGGKSALDPRDLNDTLAAAAKKDADIQQRFPDVPTTLDGYRLGVRAAIDRAAGTSPNDLVATRRLMGADDDWNRANVSSIMGEGPTNQISDAIDKYSAFRGTKNDIMSGAKTAWATQSLNELKPNAGTDSIPFFTPQSNFTGMAATAMAYPFKKGYQLMANQLASDPYASYGELARVLTAQGPQRDAYYSALVDALQRQNKNAAIGKVIGDKTGIAAALIGTPYASHLVSDQLQ